MLSQPSQWMHKHFSADLGKLNRLQGAWWMVVQRFDHGRCTDWLQLSLLFINVPTVNEFTVCMVSLSISVQMGVIPESDLQIALKSNDEALQNIYNSCYYNNPS